MQTNIILRHRSNGSVLVIVMGTVIVLAIVLAAVLSLTSHEQRVLARTSAWNTALPVAEAGIEEGMSHLRQVGNGARAANGWTADGASFVLTRTNLGGGRYTVAIGNATPPNILSRGEVWCPSAGRYISRTILVGTQRQAGGAGGINSRGTIRFTGGYLDSFDSSDPLYSTNGMYTVTKRKDNGRAVSVLGTNGAVAVGGGKIYGTAITGPGGTVTYGTGAVGDAAWIAAGNVGLQSGHTASDANMAFPTPPEPYPHASGSTITGTGGTISGYGTTNWIYALSSGNYSAASVTVFSSGNPMLVNGDVTLYVSGDFTVSGTGYVYLAPGASLKLYVGGRLTVSGGGVYNGTGYAKNLSVYGIASSSGKVWTYNGSANFIGQVDAPLVSRFTISGGASGIGSFTANNFEISGGGHISFDESLAASGDLRIASWTEL